MKADEIAARRVRVADALLARKTERQIAEELSVGKGTVSRDAKAIRAEWQAMRLATADELVAEELQRLNVTEAAIWPLVLKADLPAVDRELALMQRRARLLGLDTVQRGKQGKTSVEVEEPDGRRVVFTLDLGTDEGGE